MQDYHDGNSSLADTETQSHRFRLTWWVLGLAGVGVLLLAICLQPRPSTAPVESTPTAAAEPRVARALPVAKVADETPDPQAMSLADVIGKASLGLLVVWAVGWVLVKVRRGGWPAKLAMVGRHEAPSRLQLSESLSLGHQQAVLHLVEVDGTVLLVGSLPDQVCVLWSPAPGPVVVAVETDAGPGSEPPLAPVAPVAQRIPPANRPVRREADWAQERTRLIQSLLRKDEIA